MKRWRKKLEAWAAAIGFAEHGQWQTAEDIMEEVKEKKIKRLEKRPRKKQQQRQRPRSYRS